MTAGVDLRYTYSKWWSFARHNWRGEWNAHPDAEHKHVGVMNLLHSVQIFSWRFPVLDLRVCAKQVDVVSVVSRTLAILYPVYTIQPVVKPDVQPVWRPAVSCKRGFSGRDLKHAGWRERPICWPLSVKKVPDISHGSVATRGGICNGDLCANWLSLMVKKFWQAVSVWRSCQ